jgi:hypothetical protein
MAQVVPGEVFDLGVVEGRLKLIDYVAPEEILRPLVAFAAADF